MCYMHFKTTPKMPRRFAVFAALFLWKTVAFFRVLSIIPLDDIVQHLPANELHQEQTKRIQPLALASLPHSKFHGCNDQGFCKFSNVCFSNHMDGMLVVDDENPNSHWKSYLDKFNKDPYLDATKPNILPTLLALNSSNSLITDKMMVTNCWRQRNRKYTPFHMLMGFGKLFVLSSGLYDSGYQHKELNFDVILFHQCSSNAAWDWGKHVETIIFQDAVKAGRISLPLIKDDDAKAFLPMKRPRTENQIVCGKEVYQDPFSYYKSFGVNDHSVIRRWKKISQNMINRSLLRYPRQHIPFHKGAVSRVGQKNESCALNLRVAIWMRSHSGSSSAARVLYNVQGVEKLVSQFSNYPLIILSASEKTPFHEQISIFNSFDILITPHGSHLSNYIFSANKQVVFIVLTSVFIDDFFLVDSRHFVGGWIQSLGHLPHNNTKLQKQMRFCRDKHLGIEFYKPSFAKCPYHVRREFLMSNLVVNKNILQADLRKAVQISCQGKE